MTKGLLKNHYPLFLSLLFLWTSIVVLFVWILQVNSGVFTYVLDDPYIHISIAKNMVLHGNFGVNADVFNSATSAPLWTLILAGVYSILGINDFLPLVLTLLSSSILIAIVYFLFKKENIGNNTILLLLISLSFLAPLPALIFTGMEHSLHSLINLLFIYFGVKFLSQNDKFSGKLILVLASILTGLRYEGGFLIIIIAILLVFRKKYLLSISLLIAGSLPIVIFGLVSISHGWFFLPNTIMLKGNLPENFSFTQIIYTYGYRFMATLIKKPHVGLMVVIPSALLWVKWREKTNFWERTPLFLLIYLILVILHVLFASIGWFYRYEAYLVISGFFITTICVKDYIPQFIEKYRQSKTFWIKVLIIISGHLIFLPFVERAGKSFIMIPVASHNIYEQQYQISRFFNKFYNHQTIAVNDLGVINYYNDLITVDLFGIADMDIARAKLNHNFDKKAMTFSVNKNGARIAVLFKSWFETNNYIPENWIKVGSWEIPDNFICGDATVIFYAVDSSEAQKLLNNLKQFSNQIPADIIQKMNI